MHLINTKDDMGENKNSGTTRLPEDLKKELRKEQAPYLARGDEAPSFGALLHTAWKMFKSFPISASQELRDIAEILAAPDTTETRPFKAQLKVTISEYRKQHPEAETSRDSMHHQGRKAGAR